MTTSMRTAALKALTFTDLSALATAAAIRAQDIKQYIAQGGDVDVWSPILAELELANKRVIAVLAAI